MRTDRNSLRSYLAGFKVFDEEALAELRETLCEFHQQAELEQLFGNIREDKEWMKDIVDRSYSHKIGFDKLVLVSLENPERKLRLHVWDNETVPQNEKDADIHNHRWNFCSTLLTGTMEFEIFERGSGRKVHEYEYTPIGRNSKYSLKELGETELTQTFGGSFYAGVNYEITHDIIHRTYVDDNQTTATLMFQGPQRKPKTSVFNEEEIENPENMTVNPVSKEGISERFDEIIKCMNSD